MATALGCDDSKVEDLEFYKDVDDFIIDVYSHEIRNHELITEVINLFQYAGQRLLGRNKISGVDCDLRVLRGNAEMFYKSVEKFRFHFCTNMDISAKLIYDALLKTSSDVNIKTDTVIDAMMERRHPCREKDRLHVANCTVIQAEKNEYTLNQLIESGHFNNEKAVILNPHNFNIQDPKLHGQLYECYLHSRTVWVAIKKVYKHYNKFGSMEKYDTFDGSKRRRFHYSVKELLSNNYLTSNDVINAREHAKRTAKNNLGVYYYKRLMKYLNMIGFYELERYLAELYSVAKKETEWYGNDLNYRMPFNTQYYAVKNMIQLKDPSKLPENIKQKVDEGLSMLGDYLLLTHYAKIKFNLENRNVSGCEKEVDDNGNPLSLNELFRKFIKYAENYAFLSAPFKSDYEFMEFSHGASSSRGDYENVAFPDASSSSSSSANNGNVTRASSRTGRSGDNSGSIKTSSTDPTDSISASSGEYILCHSPSYSTASGYAGDINSDNGDIPSISSDPPSNGKPSTSSDKTEEKDEKQGDEASARKEKEGNSSTSTSEDESSSLL